MNGQQHHVAVERLTALAFVTRAPKQAHVGDVRHADRQDQLALSHIGQCDHCAARLAALTFDADALRDEAVAQADAIFDDSHLEAQRARILGRLKHLGQAARVLSFPRRPREAAMPVSTGSRRWISVAAAAGLIIGLVTGQMLHFLPRAGIASGASAAPNGAVAQTDSLSPIGIRPVGGIIPASTTLSEDELMEEVEMALLRRAPSLRALDGLTPTASELLAMGR